MVSMGGQVLGGGVVVLVAVLLWLVYLVPTWHAHHQFNAAERNALRLNRALRVLAETAEAPAEVQLELNARTALAQQRLARRVQAEQESVELEAARAALEAAKAQAAVDRERARAERDRARAEAAAAAQLARAEAAAAAERARAEAAAAAERARAEAIAARHTPELRRARARRRVRLIATVVGFASLGLAGWGSVLVAASADATLLAAGASGVVLSAGVLVRMNAVQRRAALRVVAEVPARVAADVQDVELPSERAEWTPRRLPQPLTASAGSRAAAVLDAAAAHESLRRAAFEEAARERAERDAPPSIDTARRTRVAEAELPGRGADDEQIEAHVRRLLERRASGQ